MSEGTWALIGVLVGTIGTGFFNYLLQKRQFDHNKEMFSLQNKGLENVKSILTEMLNHRRFTDRSFEALKRPIGGYGDAEIKQLLHDIGAKKYTRDDGSEWWYLVERQDERAAKKGDG